MYLFFEFACLFDEIMAIDGNIWPYMAIDGHRWPYMAIHGHVWVGGVDTPRLNAVGTLHMQVHMYIQA